MKLPRLLLLSLLAAGVTRAADEDSPAFFRNPAVSRTHIVFEYGSDLWSVSRQGGQAVRLTAGPGEETSPAFSPDGSMESVDRGSVRYLLLANSVPSLHRGLPGESGRDFTREASIRRANGIGRFL